MRIAVLGTGTVGRTLAGALAGLGHEVALGTRDPVATRARTDESGLALVADWVDDHPGVTLTDLAAAASASELVVNALNGASAVAGLETAGEEALAGKVLLDVSNPLDFGHGWPPTLLVCNTDSLAEQIQRRFPSARVVKALHTMNAALMADPGRLAGGDHTSFVAGDDAEARQVVVDLLRSLGHLDILDLGELAAARGTEMYLPLWLRVMSALGTPEFSLRIVR